MSTVLIDAGNAVLESASREGQNEGASLRSSTALVTQLAFSGGTGSGCIAEMLLRGDLSIPNNLVVIRADPGMENSKTNDYCSEMADRFRAANIPYIEVQKNLLEGLLNLKASGATRFDLPPLWTRNRETGKKGRLLQLCTSYAKIVPMDRALRKWMHENLGISSTSTRIGTKIVCKWIGFSADEWSRIKEPRVKYAYFAYPLIDKNMTKEDIRRYYSKIGRPIPPRSVCNACFANDVQYFKQMHDERPDEFWKQAVAVDEAIRDLKQVGVRDECFVSSTLLPLRQLAANNFRTLDQKVVSQCHSGYCFV
jgi:hypothetical protein